MDSLSRSGWDSVGCETPGATGSVKAGEKFGGGGPDSSGDGIGAGAVGMGRGGFFI